MSVSDTIKGYDLDKISDFFMYGSKDLWLQTNNRKGHTHDPNIMDLLPITEHLPCVTLGKSLYFDCTVFWLNEA
jgi:hypothetical protein